MAADPDLFTQVHAAIDRAENGTPGTVPYPFIAATRAAATRHRPVPYHHGEPAHLVEQCGWQLADDLWMPHANADGDVHATHRCAEESSEGFQRTWVAWPCPSFADIARSFDLTPTPEEATR